MGPFFEGTMQDFRDRVSRILNHSKKNFGEPCVLWPVAGGSIPFTGIFDNAHEAVDTEGEKNISATHPILGINLFDFETEPVEGDQIQIRNLRYKIVDSIPDGQGGSTLILHRVNHEQKVFKKKIN